jgi:citrate lyase beta subunit
VKVFYFIKYFENGFSTYFNKIMNSIAVFTFDLEDSIHDFYDEAKSCKLKDKYRQILRNVLFQNSTILKGNNIAIRINNPSTKEFSKDINFLKGLNEITWETIIIPKVESTDQIKITLQELRRYQVKFQNIAIFTETTKGLLALKEIISNNFPELKYVIFGHADYNLDNKIFPFIHQAETEYWSWVEKIFKELKDSDVMFINSPCLFLGDDDLFIYNLNKLSDIFKGQFGQMTLTLNQTIICNSFIKSDFDKYKYSNKKKIEETKFALDLIKTVNGTESDKSFSINEVQYLTCPQEVLMAKLFLDHKQRN